MGDSMDTKDLDSYGVWVKMPPQDAANNEEKSLDELLDTGAFDSIGAFPDFSEPDTDVEKEMDKTAAVQDTQDDSTDDFAAADFNDATLTEEELSNISDSMNVTEETSADEDDDTLAADDFFPDLDDTAQSAEKSVPTESEDVALDDFLDEDFTEPAAPAENTTAFTETSDDGEVSLDDFLDDVSFGGGQDEAQKEDDIPDETPLNIDLKFNEAVSEQVPVEDESSSDDTALSDTPAAESHDEEKGGFASTGNTSDTSVSAEEVDLSDFGIDASEAETPVTTGAKDENDTDKTVDYNLSVSDTAQTAAPAVQVVEDSASAKNAPATSEMNNTLLQQIVDDLSGLKNEINSLKAEFDELKSRDFLQPPPANTAEIEMPLEDTGFFSGRDEDDTIALSGDELNNIMQTADFTSDEEEQSVENQGESVFSGAEPEETVDDYFGDKTGIDEDALQTSIAESATAADAPQQAMTHAQNDEPDETVADYFGEKTGIEDEFEKEAKTSDIPHDETTETFEEPQVIEEKDFNDDAPFGTVSEDEIIIPDEEHDSGLTFDIDNEVLEEPDLDALNTLNIPEEISVPKVKDEQTAESGNFDDILVESSATDFMDSVKDTTENAAAPKDDEIFDEMLAEEPPISEVLSKENVDYLAEEERVEDVADESDIQETEGADIPSDLKADVKSVLLYMDQLLENLPEEKIMEFAKSEQFITYKKLFTELGLA